MMHLSVIDYSIILFFLLLTLVIAKRFQSTAGKSLESFFLGGRNLPWYIAGISMVATTFAADTPLAVAELIAQSGISGNWLWWNMMAGGMLTTFFFARYWRRANILTDVQLIEIRYSGKAARFLRSFKALYMGVFLNSLVIGWVNLALISILQVFFNLDSIQLYLVVFAAMLLVAVYSSISGLLGVAFNDLVQFALAMVGSIILSVIVINLPEIGGIEGLKAKLPEEVFDFFPNVTDSKDVTSVLALSFGSFFAYIGVMWWASWYPGNEPGGGGYIAQRMMSTKNEKHAIGSSLFFQIAHYTVRPWPWILVGLAALVLYPDLTESDKKLGYVLAIKDHLPVGLKGLLLAAFFSAYMSTISTQLNWGASYIVNDFYQKVINKSADQKKLVLVSRISTLLLMLIALAATTQMESISGVWQFIMECGAGLGLVLILRWYWWRINAWSEIVATIAPFIGYTLAHFVFEMEFPDSFFFTVGTTTVCWIIATFISPGTEKTVLQAFYQRIQPDGWWSLFQEKDQKSTSGYLVLAWISSIVMAYTFLFLMGKLIFREWMEAGLYLVIFSVSLAVLLACLRKTRIFS